MSIGWRLKPLPVRERSKACTPAPPASSHKLIEEHGVMLGIHTMSMLEIFGRDKNQRITLKGQFVP